MTPASTHPDHGSPVRLTLEDGTTIWGYLDLPSGNWRSLDHVTVSAVGWTPATWERALCVQLGPGDVVRLTSGAIATVSRVERTGIGVWVEAFGPTVRLRLFARAHERQAIDRLTEDTP